MFSSQKSHCYDLWCRVTLAGPMRVGDRYTMQRVYLGVLGGYMGPRGYGGGKEIRGTEKEERGNGGGEGRDCLFRRTERERGDDISLPLCVYGEGRLGLGGACLLKGQSTQVTG